MRIVFFGTPYYVIPILESLNKAFKKEGETPIAAVVTQPPKPTGRKQLLEYSEVDAWAHKREIPKFFDSRQLIEENIKADIGILASYGEIIPKAVINHFPQGILVVHPSLLPQFRWGSPVPAAIVTNTNPTGVTIIKMDEKWDHGPVITQLKEEVKPEDTYGLLRDRLFALSADMIVQMLPAYLQGKIKLKPQDDKKASFARIIKKEDAYIPPQYLQLALEGEALRDQWEIPFIKMPDGKPYSLMPSAHSLHSFIRAMDPWPIAWTKVRIKSQEVRIKILKVHLESKDAIRNTKYGKTSLVSRLSYLVLDEVQLEGKGPVSWQQFKEGYPNSKF